MIIPMSSDLTKPSHLHEAEKAVEETTAPARHYSMSELLSTEAHILEDSVQWKIYARGRIARGLEDRKAGRLVDGETAMKRVRAAAALPRAKREAQSPSA
jgi:predicted transcriptional regulator